eukprot:4487299-Amphidinium_carterae.1
MVPFALPTAMPFDLFEAGVAETDQLHEDETNKRVIGRSATERHPLVRKNPLAMGTEDDKAREVAIAMVLQILHHGSEGSDSNEYILGIQDCLAKKATGTINWCAARGEVPFPVSESLCYKCVCLLWSEGVAATRALTLKEALNFFSAIVGFKGAPEIVNSGRFQGAVFAQVDQERPLRQNPPLAVEEVRTLEYAMVLANEQSAEGVFI